MPMTFFLKGLNSALNAYEVPLKAHTYGGKKAKQITTVTVPEFVLSAEIDRYLKAACTSVLRPLN